jgi:hypothetical protein
MVLANEPIVLGKITMLVYHGFAFANLQFSISQAIYFTVMMGTF